MAAITEDSALHFIGDLVHVHKVAVASTSALAMVKLATTRLTEISDRGKLTNQRAFRIETTMKGLLSRGSTILITELGVDVACQMIAEIVANIHLLELTKLAQLLTYVLVKVQKMLFGLIGIDEGRRLAGLKLELLRGRLVHIGDDDGRTHRWLVVLA